MASYTVISERVPEKETGIIQVIIRPWYRFISNKSTLKEYLILSGPHTEDGFLEIYEAPNMTPVIGEAKVLIINAIKKFRKGINQNEQIEKVKSKYGSYFDEDDYPKSYRD